MRSRSGGASWPTDIRRLVRVAWATVPRLVLAQAVLMVLVGVVGGASLLMLVPIVNSIASSSAGSDYVQIPVVGATGVGNLPLPVLLVGVVALAGLQSLIQRSGAVNSAKVTETVTNKLRLDAYEAVLAADWVFILDRRRSDIVSTVANGAARAGQALSDIISGAVTTAILVVTALVALVLDPALAAVSIIVTLLLGGLLSASIRPAFRMGSDLTERFKTLQAVMNDSLDSLRLVRAHDAAAMWGRELSDAFLDARQVQVSYVRQAATLSAASQVGFVSTAAIIVFFAVQLGVPGPTIAIMLLLIARLARSAQALAATAQRIASHLPGVRELEEVTASAIDAAEARSNEGSAEPESPRQPAAVTVSMEHNAASGGSIRAGQPTVRIPSAGSGCLVALRDVSFRYPTGTGGVEGLSFEIPKGLITALTGPSGAGKSTTADLVLGLLHPSSGDVLIDGSPLTRRGLRAWRQRIAYVPQETVLIPGSLRRNLRWSVGDVDDDACWRALDRAAAAFAHDLPEGLDTQLGDRGLRLSGGERQRVAIARALLREPDLLVLDEATSSLDDATESAVLSLLTSLTPAVTVLVIAHRRSTIDLADRVIALAKGRMLANGGPEEPAGEQELADTVASS